MGRITADQSQAVMATIMQNTPWEGIDFDECGLQDSVMRDPQEAGRQFKIFLQNGCRIPEWREKDGIIYCSVTSDGATGTELIYRLTEKGFRPSRNARQWLLAQDFTPTNDVTYDIVIIKGKKRDTEWLFPGVNSGKYTPLNIEASSLFREKFSNAMITSMGLEKVITNPKPRISAEIVGGARLIGGGYYDSEFCGLHGGYLVTETGFAALVS